MVNETFSTFDKICAAERTTHRAIQHAEYWVHDDELRKCLMRAKFLLSEVRQASYFLADPGASPEFKEQALKRLGDSIINCP